MQLIEVDPNDSRGLVREWYFGSRPYFMRSGAYDILTGALASYVRDEIPGRSFLIAAHRGVGKTSLVLRAVEDLNRAIVLAAAQGTLPVGSGSRGSRPTPQRPLLVKLHGTALISTPTPAGWARPSAAAPKASAETALQQIAIALYRALADEIAKTFALHAIEAGRQPAQRELPEMAAQLRLDLDLAPDPAALRGYWARALRLDSGVLWPSAVGEQLTALGLVDRGMREIVAVVTANQAFQVCAGRVEASQTAKGSVERIARMESATRLDAKDAANKLFGLTAGALVGGALLQSAGGTGAAAAGLGAALLSTFALGWASERRQRSERSTDYTFILDSSLQTLDRDLPKVIDRIREAGLAPVFLIDELDKLDEPGQSIEEIVKRLKSLTTDYGFFGQDNWKVSPTLTLELGVRYDYEAIPAPAASLTAASGTYVPFPGVTNHPSDKNNIGIRVGFSKDVYGNGQTVLRGGYGMFYGRLANSTLLNTELNTGSPLGQYVTTFTPAVTGGPTFPNLATTGAAPKPGAYYFAPNLQNPMVHEYDLIVQQQLGHSTVMSVSYLGALGRELPNFLDKNLDPTTVVNHTITTVAGSNGSYGPLGTARVFTVPAYTAYGNTALFGPQATSYQNITEVVSNINSSYNAAVFEVQNRSLKNVQFDFNYTWSHALDFDQNAQTATSAEGWLDPYSNNAHQNYGNSNYNVPNRFTGYVLYSLPGLSGHAWYTYLTNGWKIDDSFQMQNGLPYSAGTSGSSGTAVTSGWYGSGGLAIVPALGVNTYKYPRKIVDDARIEKDFTYEKYSLELFAQMFNVANHQNIDGVGTTAYKLAGSGANATLTYQNATWQVPTSSNNSGFLYTPRQIEIAARLRF